MKTNKKMGFMSLKSSSSSFFLRSLATPIATRHPFSSLGTKGSYWILSDVSA
jgi:hypothetical protein